MNKALQIDFNNMLQENVPCGITREEIAAAKARIPEIHRGVEAKRRENTWRDLPFNQDKIVADIQKEAKRINDNYENFVVFGIGGSALGSKALFTALKHIRYNELPREKRGGARFYVLDNIDPDSINGLLDIIDPAKTVFHVITKSGNTVETVTQFMVALELIKNRIGEHYTDNIILTTDKENGNIKRIADEHGFKAFVVPDGVGGRFSVLCPVGLVSAAVLNIDIAALLKGAGDMDKICSNPNLEENPAYMYAMLYYLAMKKGINISVMMPYADALLNTAEWYAQLWADSLGKKFGLDGSIVHAGQTPVRAVGVTDQHSQVQLYTEGPADKIICFIEVANFRTQLTIPHAPIDMHEASYLYGQTFNKLIASELRGTEYAVTQGGKMNMRITLNELDAYAYGALLFFLEMATAACGEFLQIDAFDQPGVEAGKIATYALMGREGYEEKAAELSAQAEKDAAFVYSF